MTDGPGGVSGGGRGYDERESSKIKQDFISVSQNIPLEGAMFWSTEQ